MEVLVIYAQEPERVVEYLSGMGFNFKPEQHGTSPNHWAMEKGNQVFEIYPACGAERVRFITVNKTHGAN